jgi:hypothetical protein
MHGSENVEYTYIRLSEPYYHQPQCRRGPSRIDLKFEAVSSPENLVANRETSLSHSLSSCINCVLRNFGTDQRFVSVQTRVLTYGQTYRLTYERIYKISWKDNKIFR